MDIIIDALDAIERLNSSEQDAFLASFDDREGFRKYLSETQKRKGKVITSPRFGFKPRAFGGGRHPDSDAADIYFERFRRSKLLFIAAIDTGYRATDLRLLKRTSIDDINRVATVIPEKTRRKSGKAAVVALSDRCYSAILDSTNGAVTNTEYVFSTAEGRPYSVATVKRYFSIAKKIAGITRRCRINDLRHTFASNLASNGCNLLVIRDALGHTSTRMSERYAKPSEASLDTMRDALNRAAGTTRSTTRDSKR